MDNNSYRILKRDLYQVNLFCYAIVTKSPNFVALNKLIKGVTQICK